MNQSIVYILFVGVNGAGELFPARLPDDGVRFNDEDCELFVNRVVLLFDRVTSNAVGVAEAAERRVVTFSKTS